MGELPDEFSCTITDWEYIYGLCRDVANDVKAAEFEPDVVVALARGGWFGGRCLCDFLGLDDLASLKVEHYVGTAAKGEEAQIKYPLADGAVEGKDVLVVDDIADTGQSIETAAECVRDQNPSSVRTATLQLLQTSDHEPEFVGERLDEWTWVVYPWNFVEDMIELTAGVMAKSDQQTHTEDDIRQLLREYHGVSRTDLEIAQPNRLGEVTTEMERRGVVESVGDGWQLTDD
ncbi:phosphoribosyltransferase [Haloarcula japonica]|uniref:Purine phosphoribosyltransferase n=1 Tax=Haloarcula japonica (strain ATCC 49778 / DSM 6131 / JCM 7785 / NBRC 101032 / NCIMB 13157 / TR-1) TaxID=1227453 RepID=M0LI07_HALJT|nr:phosphoribosyltransferase [Haloarcula japonica]EMA33161.1 purine phosphoribosyltransferase [Haloarcula japonica DSM 6131]